MNSPQVYQWLLVDADATRAAGQALGRALHVEVQAPLVVTLQGELGAGKTTLVSGWLASWGHIGVVRSPTYTLIEPYVLGQRRCYHLDLYRLVEPMQLEELGFRDLLHPGALLLVEWPQRAGALLGPVDISLQLHYPPQGASGRLLTCTVHRESLVPLLHKLSI